jgi:hypothetical protein
MCACPSVYQLEKAVQLYKDEHVFGDMTSWRHFDWIYSRLGVLARAFYCVGMEHCSWWKRTFLLPVLCQDGAAYMQAFQDGLWTKSQEEVFSDLFEFFSAQSKKAPALFDADIVTFLSQPKPSFVKAREKAVLLFAAASKNQEYSWKNSETYKEYTKRLGTIVVKKEGPERFKGTSFSDVERPLEPVSEKAIDDWKRVLGQIPEILQEVFGLERDLKGLFPVARAFRRQTGDQYDRLSKMNETIGEMLDALEKDFPSLDLVRLQMSQRYFLTLIAQENQVLSRIRKNCFSIKKALVDEQELISSTKEEFSLLCRKLTRLMDSVSVLPIGNPFKVHQVRVLKEGREILKESRQSLSKGIDIMMTFEDLLQKIESLTCNAKKLYDEGQEI